ncbi:helix-turn-helix domain-containing protein [Pirellulaceae bacterium SH501]
MRTKNTCVCLSRDLAFFVNANTDNIAEFSKLVHISRSSLHNWEKGEVHSRANLSTVLAITDHFQIDPTPFIYNGPDCEQLLEMSESEFKRWSRASSAPKLDCEIYESCGNLLVRQQYALLRSEQEHHYLFVQSSEIRGSMELLDRANPTLDAGSFVIVLDTKQHHAKLPDSITSIGRLESGRIAATAFDPTFDNAATYQIHACIRTTPHVVTQIMGQQLSSV